MNKVKIGIDLGGTKVLLIAGDLDEKVETGLDFNPARLETIINSFIDKNKLSPIGIGLAIPGLLDDNDTIVSCDVLPRFKGWNAKQGLRKYNTKVRSLNDVKAALAQEFHEYDDDFTGGIIMVGTAVGSAFIVNGQPLLGESGWAGEFGYFPLLINDEVKRVDEVCGGSFLAQQLEMSSFEMYNSAINGDNSVIEVLIKGGYYLGVAIAGLINILNPSTISIGGGTSKLPMYWEGIISGAKENTISEFWNENILKKVRDDQKVAALGAIRILG